VLTGVQEPRVCSIPASAVNFDAGLDALDRADIAGRVSLDWQHLIVRNGMAKQESGAWAAFEVGVLASRQNGKNGAIEVVELGWMIDEPGVRILHTAHEFQTALESMDKLEALIRSHPDLEGMIPRNGVRHGNGKESIRLTNGSIIRFRTRTKSAGRGFSVDRLVIDEAMIYTPASMAAIMPLMTTARRPQIWYLGSAPDADIHEYCGKWTSLRARGLAGNDRSLLWLEWSAPDPPDVEDVAARAEWREDRGNWAASNPSVGLSVTGDGAPLITEEYIENELDAFRDNLDGWEIERLSAGRWPTLEDDADPIFGDSELWSAMAYEQSPILQGPKALAVAMSEDRKFVTFGMAQRTAEGQIHLEIGYHETPTPAATERLVGLVLHFDPCCLVIRAKSKAMSMAPDLAEAGIEPEAVSIQVWAQACGGFYDDAVNGLFSHSDDPRLNAAVTGARASTPGGPIEARSGAMISPLEVAILARWGLITFGAHVAAPPPSPSFDAVPENAEFDIMSAAF
jgi:hypothetical protein